MQRTNLTRRLVIWLLVLGGGYLLVFGGSSSSKPTRKRVAIEVATPHGTARGASVIEMVNNHAPWWYPAAVTSTTWQTGEAPHVDLGSRRHVFLPLHYPLDGMPLWSYLRPDVVRPDGSFPPGRTPTLVTFDDIDDPNTIRKVDPGAFEQTFGSGYHLVSLTVTDTRDPPSSGTLAAKFPVLHRQLVGLGERGARPSGIRGDLRLSGWRAFETPPTP